MHSVYLEEVVEVVEVVGVGRVVGRVVEVVDRIVDRVAAWAHQAL